MENENLAYLMGRAYLAAKKSPDPSNQNGALVVDEGFGDDLILAEGCNDFGLIPFAYEDLNDRDKKLAFIEHAERAALFAAARDFTTFDTALICPWACCTDCGRAIARMGVSKVVVHTPRMNTTPERWKKSVEDGLNCLHHYGVEVEHYNGPLELPEGFTIKANGEDWSPFCEE